MNRYKIAFYGLLCGVLLLLGACGVRSARLVNSLSDRCKAEIVRRS